MRIAEAVRIIDSVVYKPGWRITVENPNSFTSTLQVRVDYPAQNSNREEAVNGYPTSIDISASFPVYIGYSTPEQLITAVFSALIKIETHEAREFFRVRPTYDAPFHPHRVEGMLAWNRRSVGV